MRRVLGQACRATLDWVLTFARSWHAFWFMPGDASLLGLLRILTGTMLVYTHAVWGLALGDFFGPDGWLQGEAVQALDQARNPFGAAFWWVNGWSFWWIVPPAAMWWAHATALVILALFTLGIFTRVTSVLSFVITVSYIHRAPLALFGLDQINTLLALYLAVGYLATPARDRVLALDRRIALRFDWRRVIGRGRALPPAALAWEPQPSVSANIGIRLIQVHMCVIYLFAGLSKLQGPAWWSGDAMWLAFANLEYQSVDMTWLAHSPWLVNVMTHVTIVWEISFAALIWVRWCRPLVLVGAVLLHVGIGAFLGMWTFGLIMLVGCASFLPPEFSGSLARLFARAASQQRSWVEPGRVVDVLPPAAPVVSPQSVESAPQPENDLAPA